MTESDSYQIILDPVPEDKQPAAALFLSGCFSLPPASMRRIAASGPIAILSGLDGVQAETILAELTPALPENVTLRLSREGEDQDSSRLDWPAPPKIFGRPLEEFSLAAAVTTDEAPCPACGKMLRVKHDATGDFSIRLASESSRTVMIPNPASVASDKDPLFSGFKPLAADSVAFKSVRALQSGDTGFWGETQSAIDARPYQPPPEPARRNTDSSILGKSSGGLSAYMKPGVFAVVVGRSKDAAVVKKVAEIMGLSEDEARQKCLAPSLSVARDISLDEAKNLAARFKMLGARVRIAKPL